MFVGCASPRFAGARDDDVEAWYDDDEAVVQAPRPIRIARNIFDCAIAVVPPEQAVMVRGIALRRVHFSEPDVFFARLAREFDKIGRENLRVRPFAIAQIEIADAGHPIDVGMKARAEFAANDAVDFARTILIETPANVLLRDAQRSEDALEHDVVEVASVNKREAFGKPVRAAVAVMPFCAGFEEKIGVTARLLEARRLIREMPQRDFVEPAGITIGLWRHAEGWVIFDGQIIELNFSVLERKAESGHADRFGSGFQVVLAFGIAPGINEFAVTNDVPGAFAGQIVIARLF